MRIQLNLIGLVLILVGSLSAQDQARLSGGTDGLRSDNKIVFDLEGRTATVTKLVSLPWVSSDYSKRFKFDVVTNPKLKALRERYELDDVIAPGKDEFEKQLLLMDWVHHRFKKFGRPSTDAQGALQVLEAIDEGHSFFCPQYGQVMISCAASLGWVDRALALRRHQGVNKKGGSTEHTTTEIWSNQFSKWVMLDPTSNMYLEKDGIPLNAWEIRQEWFYNEGKDLVVVVGKDRKRHTKDEWESTLDSFEWKLHDGANHVDVRTINAFGVAGSISTVELQLEK